VVWGGMRTSEMDMAGERERERERESANLFFQTKCIALSHLHYFRIEHLILDVFK
jgi:hypothetical protein